MVERTRVCVERNLEARMLVVRPGRKKAGAVVEHFVRRSGKAGVGLAWQINMAKYESEYDRM